jgi:glucose dehydrogenase
MRAIRQPGKLVQHGLSVSLALLATTGTGISTPVAAQDWGYYGGSHSFDRYSPLDQINRKNVGSLKVLWTRPGIDPSIMKRFPDLSPSHYFRGTPIMIGGTLFAPDAVGLVEAFDAKTGATKWVQQPFAETLKEAAGNSTRGVDHWKSGDDERIIAIRGDYLYALNAKTGGYYPDFGQKGRVSLRRITRDNAAFVGLNGPIVVGDVIVVGGNGGGQGAGDGSAFKEASPEDVRGYDVRSGALLWTFHVLPQGGEPGHETWPDDAATQVGNMGAWASMSADEKLGYVYLPLTAPTNSYYGGHRKGDNLYSSSLVVLDAKTGKKVWHYQMVHHDLWDYDNASPPTLATLKVNGKTIDAVIQPNKTGFLFVFDRKTGVPVWPIEERAVPQSTTPGEYTSPTQPFPTKPPAFDRQGITPGDLIDFTPALAAEAKKMADRYALSPIFTPAMLYQPGGKIGALTAPGAWGTGNWNTGAFDPETGMYYAVSMTLPGSFALSKPKKEGATIAYGWADNIPDEPEEGLYGIGPQGLPLLKPPYGRITAYDMNKGDKLWTVANGDGPRDHPALKGLKLPPLGNIGRPVPLLTKSLLFLGESSDALYGKVGVSGPSTFRAYDKKTGAVVWHTSLPAGTTGGPVTYAVDGKQLLVVPVGSKAYPGEWVALGLPE